jgi:hypothetical protein
MKMDIIETLIEKGFDMKTLKGIDSPEQAASKAHIIKNFLQANVQFEMTADNVYTPEYKTTLFNNSGIRLERSNGSRYAVGCVSLLWDMHRVYKSYDRVIKSKGSKRWKRLKPDFIKYHSHTIEKLY